MPFNSVSAIMFGIALLCSCQLVRADPVPQDQQQLERIKTGFQTALDKLQQEYRQAESDDQRQQIQNRYQQLQTATVADCLKLAAANRGTALAERTFSWLFRAIVDQQARQVAQDRWLEFHVNDASLAPTLVILGMADDRDFLRKIIERATNRTVLSAACFNLAMSLRRDAAPTKDDEAEAIALLERIENQFANLVFLLPDAPPGGRLGDLAAPPLFELKHLSVGKSAPDIEGQDIDGDSIRLSEYRGKIVVLSFWGDW